MRPYRYTGQQLDTATGLYSLRARYYNPALGRFLSGDTYPYSFGNPVELNRYAYTANNPINAMDPSGHLLIEYAVNLAETTVVYAGLGEMFGVVSAYLCGQNLLEGAKAGFWIGAAFGSGGILAPEMTAAVGAGMGLYGLGTSLYDMSVNGITFCNLFNALGSALLVKGSVEVLTPGSLHPNDKLNSFDLSPELNRASSDSKGNSIDPAELAQIIAELKKEGVEVDMGKEFEQLLAMENKEAQYIPRKNRPGLS